MKSPRGLGLLKSKELITAGGVNREMKRINDLTGS